MLKSWTTAFQVDGQWYDMDEAIYQRAKRKAGKDWTNRRLLAILKNLGYEFETNPKNDLITIR